MKEKLTTYQKYGWGAPRVIKRLLEQYERLAALPNPECPTCQAREAVNALRVTGTLLNGHATTQAKDNHPATLAKAIAISATRQGRLPSKVALRRQQSAEFLEQFDTTEPRQPTEMYRGIGPLVRRGYLKPKGDGYIRTAKPFSLKPPPR